MRSKSLIAALLLIALHVSARDFRTVSGTVLDADGAPVPGVAVLLEGTASVGVTTDSQGNYSLRIPDSDQARLIFSCIGYRSLTLPVGRKTSVNATLEYESQELEESVVVGYGAMRRSDLTGAVTTVRINEGSAGQNSTVDHLLQGRAAGVQVLSNGGAPDGGMSIRIRGLSSFNGDGQPLYVVDGIVLSTETVQESMLSQDKGAMNEETNSLAGINTQDIESIEILKDASATAIYGALGANGVVLITTRTAKRDRPTVQVSSSFGVARQSKKMDLMSFDEYVQYLGQRAPSQLSLIYTDPATRSGLKVVPVDWQDYVMRTAVRQRYYVSVSGRPKSVSYLFSFGYSSEQGVIRQTGSDQYTIRLNADKLFSKTLKAGVKASLAFIHSNMTQGTSINSMGAESSMIRSVLMYVPYYSREAEEALATGDELRSGPNRWLTDYENTRNTFRITPSAYLQYQFLPWLTFKSTLGADCRDEDRGVYKSSRINRESTGSLGAVSAIQYMSANYDNTLQFKAKFFGGHRISGTLGMSARTISSDTRVMEGWNLPDGQDWTESLNVADHSQVRYTRQASSTLSWFVRAIYNYRDRYVLTGTFRADGSSRFSASNRWGTFPSFAFAWRASQEPWFPKGGVSSLKLRLGWGQVGNQSVSNYRHLTTYESAKVASHIPGDASGGNVALYPSNLANPGLKWETTEQYNGGLDVGFWKGRLSFSMDAYYKFTRDLLQYKSVPTSSGVSKIWVNEGNISNRGLEFTLEATPFKSKDCELTMGGNLSFNRNRIESINPDALKEPVFLNRDKTTDVVYFYGATIGSGAVANYPANIFVEGKPMGLFYGLATDGIVQTGETGVPFSGTEGTAPGSIKYLDLNRDGIINEKDRTVIGNPNPDFTYGFSLDLRFRHISLNAAFTGSHGNDILNINNLYENDLSLYTNNHHVAPWKEAWTTSNPGNRWPGVMQGNVNDRLYISDRIVEDGSYLRLAQLTLNWDIPLKEKRTVKALSLSLSATNLFVITRYSGWDPDVNSYGSNVNKMGLDSGSYPSARGISTNVKLTF